MLRQDRVRIGRAVQESLGVPLDEVCPFPPTPTPWARVVEIVAGSRRLVARVHDSGRTSVEERRSEFVFASAMGRLGAGPALVGGDPELGVMLMERVQSTSVGGEAPLRPPLLVASVLKRLHDLEVEDVIDLWVSKFSVAKTTCEHALAVYPQAWAWIGAVELEAGLDHLLPGSPEQLRWCHLDPNRHNVLMTDGGVLLIDYDHVGRGHPFLDLAIVAATFELDASARRALLDHYLQRPATKDELHHLDGCVAQALLRYAVMVFSFCRHDRLPPVEAVSHANVVPWGFRSHMVGEVEVGLLSLAIAFLRAAVDAVLPLLDARTGLSELGELASWRDLRQWRASLGGGPPERVEGR